MIFAVKVVITKFAVSYPINWKQKHKKYAEQWQSIAVVVQVQRSPHNFVVMVESFSEISER